MAPRSSTEANPAAPGSQGVETMGKPRAGGLFFSVSSVTSCFIAPALHPPREIPRNLFRRFPLCGVEAGSLPAKAAQRKEANVDKDQKVSL